MRLLFLSGGTVGSLTPMIAVAEELTRMKPEVEILFLTSSGTLERQLIRQSSFRFRTFPLAKWRRYFDLRNVWDLLIFLFAFLKAMVWLPSFRPNLIASAGSSLAVPIVWAAKFWHIPVALHQQDVQPGLANRLMARTADLITVALEKSQNDFPKAKKLLWTGNPIRPGIFFGDARRAQQRFHLKTGRPLVLVLGGSSGSAVLNEIVGRAAPLLTDWSQVVHISGQNRQPIIAANRDHHVFPFVSDGFADLLALADLIVTRAGFSTLSELAALGKTTVIVPMPLTHQEANARFFQDRQAAVVLEQSVLTPQKLASILQKLFLDKAQRSELQKGIRALYRAQAQNSIAKAYLQFTKKP